MNVIAPGQTVGILGAGQLGRMLAMVARRMGYKVVVFGGDRSSPAGQVSDHAWAAEFSDEQALTAFTDAADVVTYEFENIPADFARKVAGRIPLRPGVRLLEAAQNRFIEKSSLQQIGLPTARFRMVHSGQELAAARDEFGGHVILKANTDGYDGKGQWSIDPATDVDNLWSETGLREAIVEERVDFEFEFSVIGGRFEDGRTQLYPPFLNHHVNHILDVTVLGSPLISGEIATAATEMVRQVLNHFDVTGVLCVEFFLGRDGRIAINEIAPRPHNSGHLTIEACGCSQFELQLRTVCGLPPVELSPQPAAAMANLLGQHLPPAWSEQSLAAATAKGVQLHLYGKYEARDNRKMGHLTQIADSAEAVEAAVRKARADLL